MSDRIPIDTYQQAVLGGKLDKDDEWNEKLVTTVLGVAGEAGEIADLLKKSRHQGRSLDLERLVDEAGDLLWYLTRLAGMLDLSLEELAFVNMVKLARRWPGLYGHMFVGGVPLTPAERRERDGA